MNDRIIDITDQGASLSVDGGLLVIQPKDGEKATIPFSQIGVVIMGNPMIRITNAALARVVQEKGMVIVCENYLPVAMLMPIGGHSTASRNYHVQVQASRPLVKQLWAEIIRKKIRFQAGLLDMLGKPHSLYSLLAQVRSGDSANVEGHAARQYWTSLFGEEFARDRDLPDANRFLNYGYIVLRSCVARAVCASGLHPSFGIHHHNKYNAYGLVDDLIEPFRPLVDRRVFRLVQRVSPENTLTPEIKRELIDVTQDRVHMGDRWFPLFEALSLVSASLLESYEQRKMCLRLPEEIFE